MGKQSGSLESVGQIMKTSLSDFYNGKKVFITGHTSFKGTWLCEVLSMFGANITGYSFGVPTDPSLFDICQTEKKVHSYYGDIRDLDKLESVFDQANPEIVFHLAAQPIVRESYRDPVRTYDINVMGTVNILECTRKNENVKSFLNITTDKVYHNKEWDWGYRETDELDGYDPYSNSKSCSELVTHGYKNSFFNDREIAVSTARAGNVIGGGDFAKDRIIPDCVNAAVNNQPIIVRNPYSIRPYQHVLEAVCVYLMLAMAQYEDKSLQGYYNIGPDDNNCCRTGELVDMFIKHWGDGISWINQYDGGPHEASYLKLDCSKLKNTFDWKPVWNLDEAIKRVVDWSKCWITNDDISQCMKNQINDFMDQWKAGIPLR